MKTPENAGMSSLTWIYAPPLSTRTNHKVIEAKMGRIKVAVIGIGNCASALVQGMYHYRGDHAETLPGLMHPCIGGYTPADIEVVAAFDIDTRKVGRDLSAAVLAPPNCTQVFCKDIPETGVVVRMGRIGDGVSPHMKKPNPRAHGSFPMTPNQTKKRSSAYWPNQC